MVAPKHVTSTNQHERGGKCQRRSPETMCAFTRLPRIMETKLDDRSSQSLALLSTLCSPCVWCTNLYAQIRADEIRLDSLWLRKETNTRNPCPNKSLYTYRDRGDSSGLQSAAENNRNESRSLLESHSTYEGHTKRTNTLKNKLHRRLTSLGSRSLFRSEIREDTDILKSREGTFYVRKIFGDGNCMYRSVSYIIWGDEGEHRSLRTMVVEHIKDNWRDYSAFVMAEWNISNRQEYYDYMIANGTYATELECVVATKLYHMNLSIYREIGETGNLERIFYNRVNKNYRTARLLFSGRTDSGHYDALIPD